MELSSEKNTTIVDMLSKLGNEYNKINFYLYNAETDKHKVIRDKNSTEIVTNDSYIYINFDGTYDACIWISIK